MIMYGECNRCGAKDSMFWYPYAFGVAPVPVAADRHIDRAQYYQLCDKCQQEFVEFMYNAKEMHFEDADIDAEKLKKLMDEQPIIIPTPEEYK